MSEVQQRLEAIDFAKDVAHLDRWITALPACSDECRRRGRRDFVYNVLIQLVMRAPSLTQDEQADLCQHILASEAAR